MCARLFSDVMKNLKKFDPVEIPSYFGVFCFRRGGWGGLGVVGG